MKNTLKKKTMVSPFFIGAFLLMCFQLTNAQTRIEPPPFVIACDTCIGSFSPEPGQYIISAWVKPEVSVATQFTYTQPQIVIEFYNQNVSIPSEGPFTASGNIIDGWQRIESKFTVPAVAVTLKIILNCTVGNCLFDDVRVFPIDGSLKSYVYDPINLRLVAELDERNYATFYEYDEEGKLIRVKKETEKGIMSIKENRDFTNKK